MYQRDSIHPLWYNGHAEHIALLQHISLYESIASWAHRAQNMFLGKAVIGSELRMLASSHFKFDDSARRTERAP